VFEWLIRKDLKRVRVEEEKPRARKKRAGKGSDRLVVPAQFRMYQSARPSRLTGGWGTSTSSADQELVSSLVNLRNRCRALVRDAAYAKRAKVIVQNNVVGSGIGMQANVMSSRDTLREDVNDVIEEAWGEWMEADSCHTGGRLHFCDFERALIGQVFESGEIFIRKHMSAFGNSRVPFALEMIEPERIADELTSLVQSGPALQGGLMKMGLEVDRYHRPLAYWIRERHPGDLRFVQGETDRVERVPADQIIHLAIIDRWPQTRGEPWLHAVARKLNDMDGYSEAEITAARGGASYMGSIETPEGDTPLVEVKEGGTQEFEIEPGTFKRLFAGEKLNFHSPNRPNTALDPFMRYMLREVAAGVGCSYESLSRDYSQSNYSSSRLALLDDRDLWRMIQGWFIRNFRHQTHRIWLQQAVLARAIPGIRLEEYAAAPRKFEAVRFKPRGWGWVDPTKEVEAYKEAVKAGFTTVSDVIAATGGGQDLEDILRQRDRELKMMEQLDLVFDTSPSVYVAESKLAPAAPPKKKEGGKDDGDPPDDDDDKSRNDEPQLRLV